MIQLRKPLKAKKKGKMAIVAALYTGATLIIASGAWFAVYSILNDISFKILNNSIPGVIFGLLVMYFGVRSLLSAIKLSKVILDNTSYFSWNNFKKA